jgi:cell shape-determining protein MreC
MMHLQRSRENRLGGRGKKVIALMLLAGLLLMIFNFWPKVFAAPLLKIIMPLSQAAGRLAENINLALNLLEPELTLVSENHSLKKRNTELEAQLFDYNSILTENELLRERLDIAAGEYTIASVLMMPPQTPFDTLIIDRGAKSGVFEGAKVLMSNKAALGFVREVGEDFARVVMYSSSGIRTNAVLERDGTVVELEGRGGGNFFLEAPLGFDIIEDDTFLISGSERLIVAIASSIKREENSSFISVLLRAPLKLTGNSTLLVETK